MTKQLAQYSVPAENSRVIRVFLSSTFRDMEMGSRYLDALHTFFGIGEYACIAADGMNVAGFDAEASLRRAMQEAAQLAASL